MKKILFLLLVILSVSCSKSDLFKAGDVVYTNQETVGAITSSTFDRMISVSNAKDGIAFGEMVYGGELYIIKENQSCKVLDIELGKIKCRVEVGGIDRELWINSEHLKN